MPHSHETLLNNLNLNVPSSKPLTTWLEEHCPHYHLNVMVEIHNENNVLYCVMFETLTTLDQVCLVFYASGELGIRDKDNRVPQRCHTQRELVQALHSFTTPLPDFMHEAVERAMAGYEWPASAEH